MRLIALFVALSLLFVPSLARADAKACVAHHAKGKELRKGGKPIGAKAEFLQCADDGCPKLVREECRELVGKLAAETPSIVVVAKDGNGGDVTSGKVLLDGNAVDGALGGRSIEVDPGPHSLEVVTESGQSARSEFVARDGEKNRSIELRLAKAPGVEPAPSPASSPGPTPEPDAPKTKATPVVAYVLAGVAAVGFGSFAYFALDGTSKKSDLDECKPNCKQSDVDAMRKSFLIGDISLGVGALALGGSLYFFLSPGTTERAPGAALAPRFIGVRGRF